MRQAPSRLLLTGASGLFGRALLPALGQAGFEVVPVGRRERDLPAYRRCDLADRESVRDLLSAVRPGVVVHCAGGAEGGRQQIYRSNVLSTLHLLEAARSLEPRPYFVLFGSAAEYGAQDRVLREDAPLQPLTEYGRAKVAQTALAEGIAAAAAIPWTLLRPFNVVARDLPSTSPLGNLRSQLLAEVADPRPIRCGRLDVVRDFVPIEGVAKAVAALLRNPAPGATINLASGVGLTLESILRAMAERVGVRIEIEVDPVLAALPAAPFVIGDPARMRELLGFEIPVSAEALAALLVP